MSGTQRISSYLPVFAAMCIAAAASLTGAIYAADHLEETALVEVTGALGENGVDWARVNVNGLQVRLSGEAPDEAQRFHAVAVAGGLVDATRVIDAMTVAPGQTIEAPRFGIEILRNLDGISLIGLIPAATDRAQVLERVGAVAGDDPVTDLLEVGEYPVPEGWDAALGYALDALEELPRSKVSVSANAVAITAIMETEEEQRRIETRLTRAAPDGVAARLDINAPRPVIAPFITRVLLEDGTLRFDACSADTDEARQRILSAAVAAGFAGRAQCDIGLGAPSLEWGNAVAEGIAALSRMGGGKITFSDADISLISLPTIPQSVFDREVGELERALPEGFSLHAVTPEPVAVDGTGDAPVEGAPEFVATRSPEGEVQLRGRVADSRSRTTIESLAHARFGVANTYGATRLDPELPPGWGLRVLAALDALAHVHNGSVIVQPDYLAIRGETGIPDATAQISQIFAEQLGAGADYELDVRYNIQLDPIAGLPTPEECVADLNAVIKASKITFEPGSSDLSGDAGVTIDALVEILRECREVEMEIGGHTDSQGREVMNERLSQARANAVLEAIMAARILTGNLTAKGYGESIPIADNETEEGREANRRIEFKLLTATDVEEDVADADADADADAQTEEAENEQN
ncbi:MAG: OmpA family protein [Pseudomonadota bacterium]